ncbi:hypothetical protein HMI55_005317 [Coelomomyces lativittatus]|nr:hypothetical protein HMI55_005317 [Coelomomyces lativittatus]
MYQTKKPIVFLGTGQTYQDLNTLDLSASQWTGLMNSWIQTEWISSTRASSPPPLQGGEGRCTLTSLPQLTLQWYVPPHPASWISVIGYPTSLVQEVQPYFSSWVQALLTQKEPLGTWLSMANEKDLPSLLTLVHQTSWQKDFKTWCLNHWNTMLSSALHVSSREEEEGWEKKKHVKGRNRHLTSSSSGRKMGNEKNIETSLLHLHRGRSASSMSTPPKEKTTPTSPFHPTKPSSETQTSSSSSIQKAPRKWTSTPLNASEMAALDYSDPTTTTPSTTLHASTFSSSSSSTGSSRSMKKKPSYPPTPSSRLSTLTSTSSPSSSSYFGWLKTYLETHFSPNHVLTSDDVTPLFTQMETTLLKKNVAHEVTQHLHQAMVHDLVGQRVGWQSLQSQCTQTFMNVCDRLFMAIPPSSFLPSIQQKTQSSTTASSSFSPYVVCVCGVNGVGKSTQVAKLAYWCLSHQCSVLMVACDTFRSGAIEQLRTHVDRLTQAKPWTTSSSSSSSSIPSVALFAKEYGKDPSHIAKEAIQYAQVHHFQVVLLDTAGRMQNNEPLMRALAKVRK